MKQQLDTDEVTVDIPAPVDAVYPVIADVTRMTQLSLFIRSVEWLDGATGPAVGARFKAVNKMGLRDIDGATRLTQSYRVVSPITPVGWFVIGTLYGIKDDRALLRDGMVETLDRLRALVTHQVPS